MNEGHAINISTKFEVIHCCKCGIPFAVPERIRRMWLESGDSFYCPNGHRQAYCDSAVKKLEKRLQQETRLGNGEYVGNSIGNDMAVKFLEAWEQAWEQDK